MKVNELLAESDELTEFLTKWYFDHELVSSSDIDEMIRKYPQFKYKGDARRVITLTAEEVEPFKTENPKSWDPKFNSVKLEAYIKENEPNRYVSGSATFAGLTNFLENGNGLDPDDYKIDLDYEKVFGLALYLMAKSVQKKTNPIQRIIDVREVLFKPQGASFFTIMGVEGGPDED